MIKYNELRIGNIVNHIYDTIQIESVSGDSVNLSAADMGGGAYIEGIDCKDIEPIPLTAEWLEKFGFSNEGKNVFTKEHLKIGVDDNGGANWVFYFDHHLSLHSMSYVHQLQNLYFALTGEELTIKETA